jgi:hypothetical protein
LFFAATTAACLFVRHVFCCFSSFFSGGDYNHSFKFIDANAEVAAYSIAGVPQIRGVFGANLWTRKRYHQCCGNLGGGLL